MSAPSMSRQSFDFLRERIYAGSGIVLEGEKQYLLEARLAPVAHRHGFRSIDDLCEALRREIPGLEASAVEAVTTNETYFFREPAHFEVLRKHLLPPLIELRQTARKLTFWSAAASSGQEALSIAMLLAEMGLSGWTINILGTDLCSRVLEQGAGGRYSQLEVNRGLPIALLMKYFRRSGLEWQVNNELLRMVRFQRFDLRSDMKAMGPFDIVFCRNVLIYFDLPTRRKILEQIHGTLFRGGHLILGTTETSMTDETLFERTTVDSTTVYVAR